MKLNDVQRLTRENTNLSRELRRAKQRLEAAREKIINLKQIVRSKANFNASPNVIKFARQYNDGHFADRPAGMSRRAFAAARAGVSEGYFHLALKLLQDAPEFARQVERGQIKLRHAAKKAEEKWERIKSGKAGNLSKSDMEFVPEPA